MDTQAANLVTNPTEPTTGKIVRALKLKAKYGLELPDNKYSEAADRLESQENEIEELKAEAIVNALENAERIANLTARAEQAEAREREAVKDMETLMRHSNAGCVFCKKKDTGCKDGCIKPKWRGQPQEGEGKQNG